MSQDESGHEVKAVKGRLRRWRNSFLVRAICPCNGTFVWACPTDSDICRFAQSGRTWRGPEPDQAGGQPGESGQVAE